MGVMPSIAIRKGYVEFYERDCDIYDLYIPIIKRLSAAGWEPVTHARVAQEGVRIERFGPQEGVVYFTLLNEGAQACEVTLTIDALALGAGGLGVESITELLSGRPVEPDGPALEPGELAVLAVELAD
jgi:hypothetical protein